MVYPPTVDSTWLNIPNDIHIAVLGGKSQDLQGPLRRPLPDMKEKNLGDPDIMGYRGIQWGKCIWYV